MRLGDHNGLWYGARPAGTNRRSYHPGSEVPILQQVAAFGCVNVSIILNAVVNFDDTGAFGYRHHGQRFAERYIAGHLEAARQCGLPVTLRSSADVDSDQCFLVSAAYFVPSVGGFSLMMREMRRVLRAINSNRTRPFLFPQDSERACALRQRIGASRLPKPRPPTTGMCEHQKADCARLTLKHRVWHMVPEFVKGRNAPSPGSLWPLVDLRDDVAERVQNSTSSSSSRP